MSTGADRIPLPLGEGLGEGSSAAAPMSETGTAPGCADPSPKRGGGIAWHSRGSSQRNPTGEGKERAHCTPSCRAGGLRRAGLSKLFPFFRYYSLTRHVPHPISAPSTPEVRPPRPADALSKRSERRNRREATRFPARRRRSAIGSAIQCATLCATPCAKGLDGRTPSASTLRFRRAMLAPILPGGAAPGVDRRSRSAGRLEKFLPKVFLRISEMCFSNDSKGLGLAACKKTRCIDRSV